MISVKDDGWGWGERPRCRAHASLHTQETQSQSPEGHGQWHLALATSTAGSDPETNTKAENQKCSVVSENQRAPWETAGTLATCGLGFSKKAGPKLRKGLRAPPQPSSLSFREERRGICVTLQTVSTSNKPSSTSPQGPPGQHTPVHNCHLKQTSCKHTPHWF